MSSLLASYRKLTDPTNQGVFDNEEILLSQGRVFQGGVIERAFGDSVVLDFIITSGINPIAISKLDVISDSEEFKLEFFLSPAFTGGTPVLLFNQLAGSTRSALTSIIELPTISDDGTPGTVGIVRGIAGQGNSSGLAQGGIESLTSIAPNTSLMLRVTNQGAVGELDLRIRLGEVPTTI